MKVGYSPVMYCGTNRAISKLTKINWKMEGKVKALNPPSLKQNESAEVVFTLTTPIFLKPSTVDEGKGSSFCRLAFMDSNNTVMVGKVTSVAMTTHTSVECGVLKPFVPQVLESVTNGMRAVNIIKAAAAATAASDSGKLMTRPWSASLSTVSSRC